MRPSFTKNLDAHFEHSHHFFYIVTDTFGRFLYTNFFFETTSGYIPQEHTPFYINDIIPEKEKEKSSAAIKECLKDRDSVSSVSLRCCKDDGSFFCVKWELSVLPDNKNKPELIQWIGIEEDKKAEQVNTGDPLVHSELFYRNLIADSLDGILLTNEKGIISFASASVAKILGYQSDELLNKNAFDFLHPDDRASGVTAFYNEIERNVQTRYVNARLLHKSGEWLWCVVRGHDLFSNPYIGAMLIYFCDDTMRKNAEIALMESEQRFRHLIHNLHLGVFLLDHTGKVLICNQAALRLVGVREEDFLNKQPLEANWDIIHENGSVFLPADYPISMGLHKKTVTGVVMGVYRPVYADRVWLFVNVEPVLDNENNLIHVICSFTDITEPKRLSRQLIEQEIQKQKQLMQATIDGQEKQREEIGRELHDNISQHLTTTRLYLEVAEDKAEGEVLKAILHAHKGIMDIVTEIRHLSQSLVPPSLNDIGLIASIEDLCSPLKTTHAFTVDFQYHKFNESLLPENMKLMLFRIIQEQINNIIRHAEAQSILVSLKTGDDRVTLLVSDNGKGFDLKSVKKGLGFDNISNRAGLFGGKLRIITAPGKGCSVGVTIPL